MQELAVVLRTAQLVAHNYHNKVSGASFFADHEYLGELYGAYEAAYDGVVERIIGLGEECDLPAVTQLAGERAAKYDPYDRAADEMFSDILAMEKQIQQWCVEFNKKASIGTQNFLQGLADQSEMRVYKLKQRIK
jgi:DNA-binding ferritin-like protein